ncbi:WhiB family transcriptional regulator [Streptomyces actinomycinicus]|uniref:WhiB family transcriptional regulator n=1 Tax=Streptomyces actinomycinicus TaxID=1695166 RepID=A0A937EJQ9_9ACTN|nr:WhiB family transcriptional regulator [Streptomyces actinomycinicus]MBL1083535.1 WhiB family transcriptional regulator [Streptomyces actinomycinicus]
MRWSLSPPVAGGAVPSRREHWREHAACHDCDLEELFGDSPSQKPVTALCTGCRVRTECLLKWISHSGVGGRPLAGPASRYAAVMTLT